MDIWEYAYLAVPVAEILPDLKHPRSGESLASVADALRDNRDLEVRPDVRLGRE